jgi:endonuclease
MNNHVSNLEWCDAYTNMMHAIRTGLRRTGVGSHQTPFAVTDATGKVLRAYPSMKEMVREERLKPAHRNWLILQLKHPDRVKQHALRVQHHRGDAFIMVQTRPNQTTVLNRTTIPNRPTMPNQTTTPPMDAPFSPVLHSVTKQYYRQLSKEEAIAFGVISRAVCKQERRILP